MVIYRDRSYSGLGVPVNNDGVTRRPLLLPLRETITCHYPGSPVGTTFAAMAGDVKKKTYVTNVQRSAIANGKSFEYNYFIFMDGEIWEYAGDYLAAHSSGENPIAIGVQFVNGQDDLCTDAQVVAFHWLRDTHLAARGRITDPVSIIPHRHMPGAATQCPGDRAVMPRMDDLRAEPLPPPEPPPEEDATVFRILILEDAGGAAILLQGAFGRWLDPTRYNAFHYFYPYIVDEPATKAWLANVVMLGPLPPGVRPPTAAVAGDVWGWQPDAG